MVDLTPMTQETEDAIHQFRIHFYSLRGYVEGPTPALPPDGEIGLHPDVIREGEATEVEYHFTSPPVAAFFDGKYPLQVNAQRTDRGFRISLSAPKGLNRRGPVHLVWPSKTLLLRDTLWVKRQSSVGALAFNAEERGPGEIYLTAECHHEPLEVHVGGMELDPGSFTCTRGQLIIHVPQEAPDGPVLIVTHSRVYQSAEPYLNPFRPKQALDSKAVS